MAWSCSQATESAFKSVEDYAAVWCEWAEMEIRQKQYAQALAVMQQAIAEPPRRSAKQMLTGAPTDVPVKDRVHRSVKLWALYIDLEVHGIVTLLWHADVCGNRLASFFAVCPGIVGQSGYHQSSVRARD
jgi:hypothetical protein